MAERVSASIEIGGHLETIEEADRLIEALIREVIIFNTTDEKLACVEDGQTALRMTIEAGKSFAGYDFEVDHGNFDEIDAVSGELPSLWFSTSHGTGGNFVEGVKTIINGERFECMTSEGAPVVSLAEIESIIHANRLAADPIAAFDELVAKTRRSAGLGLPPLTASPAVHAWLKIFGEKAA